MIKVLIVSVASDFFWPQVTASGDQTAKLWDVKTTELLGTFKGHQCSLKSVAFPKQEKGTMDFLWKQQLYLQNPVCI